MNLRDRMKAYIVQNDLVKRLETDTNESFDYKVEKYINDASNTDLLVYIGFCLQ